jgi:hypothetical protein
MNRFDKSGCLRRLGMNAEEKYEASAEDLFEGLTSLSTSVKLISFADFMDARMWKSFGLIIM